MSLRQFRTTGCRRKPFRLWEQRPLPSGRVPSAAEAGVTGHYRQRRRTRQTNPICGSTRNAGGDDAKIVPLFRGGNGEICPLATCSIRPCPLKSRCVSRKGCDIIAWPTETLGHSRRQEVHPAKGKLKSVLSTYQSCCYSRTSKSVNYLELDQEQRVTCHHRLEASALRRISIGILPQQAVPPIHDSLVVFPLHPQ